MKSSIWRRWCESLRNARPAGPVSRAGPRGPRLRLQPLEDRVTPTLTPQMVLDINTTTLPSNPTSIAAIGPTAYFAANDGHGYGLWKSDGTAAGTALVKQFPTATNGTLPILDLTNVNGTLYFSGNDR